MATPYEPEHTLDLSPPPADSLDAGLAAGFGRRSEPPRTSREGLPPVMLKQVEGESSLIVKPNSDAMPARSDTGDRYHLSGEIARGGMGAILRGRDEQIGRDLAVKVLLEKHAKRPEIMRRFIEEAQISGQLQHPGVVPVYDIGHFGDRPFFTMKLVKGQTLAAILSERTDASHDRPRLLSIALQVAQTLAYAHAKGVIHRDLKPANIMVGAFGEVQVMDWGLAKVLVEGGIADEQRAQRAHEEPQDVTVIRTARSSGTQGFGTGTEVGSLLGTPGYMPPEQANGDNAHLDRRADVFGLGAILCEILTGKPPYVGRSVEEVRRKCVNGDLADALSRLDGCAADHELIALTKACLAAEAIDRPKDAQAVADGLTSYLNGVQERLHQAELAETEAKAKAGEEVKRRRLTLALAATVLLALTLGGGGWLWVKAEHGARQAQMTRDVHAALNQATAFREQAKAAPAGSAALFAKAREQAQRALALVENGPADAALGAQVRQLQAELDDEEKDRKLITALDEAWLAQAETQSENRYVTERALPVFREAFRAYGLPAGEGEPAAAAERIRQRPAAVQAAIFAALDEWDDLAGSSKPGISEPHREWLRAVLAAAEPEDAWGRHVRAARAEKGDKRTAALEKLAASADVAKVPARALARLAVRLEPAPQEALLRRAQAQYPADFWVNHNLGLVQLHVTPPQYAEAVRFLTAAVALRPDSPGCALNLGSALRKNGQVDEAIPCYRKAIELDPNYFVAHYLLGVIYCDIKRDYDGAMACFHKALELDPKDAMTHCNLGVALAGKGQMDEAIAYYRKAIELDPMLANAQNCLGNALDGKGQVDEAIACWRKAIELDPQLAKTHNSLGGALREKGQVDEAIACFEQAIELDPQLAGVHYSLGILYCDIKRDYDVAIACFRTAIELDAKDAKAHCNLGVALAGKGQVEEAIPCFQKAIELDPKLANAQNWMANVLEGKGQVDEAIACWRKAIELDPQNAKLHNVLGSALRGKGQVDEAIECWRKASELDPQLAGVHNNLGALYFNIKRDFDGAIACFRKAIELDAKDARAHCNLGAALAGKGQVDEAIPCFRKAIELDAMDARAQSALANVLIGKGDVDEAIVHYQKAIELDPKSTRTRSGLAQAERLAAVRDKFAAFQNGSYAPANNAERLALAEWCKIKKLHYTTTGLYAAAFAADPTLVDDPNNGNRYNAACYAALASVSQSEDAARLDDTERAQLRKQALDWLRADLALRTVQQKDTDPAQRLNVQRMMRHWQQDPDLATLRDAAHLEKLPAEERAALSQLWADVAELLTPAK